MLNVAAVRSHSQRMSGEDRKQQIVDVATELFSQKGFRGTTTKEIADQAGVSEAIIFRHFPTKKELYSAILNYKLLQTAEWIEAKLIEIILRKDDYAYFNTLAYEILEIHKKDQTMIRLLTYCALEHHEMAEMFYKMTLKHMRKHLHDYITQRIVDGVFKKVNSSVAARAFIGMVFHHAQIRTFYGKNDIGISNMKYAQIITELFLGGMKMC